MIWLTQSEINFEPQVGGYPMNLKNMAWSDPIRSHDDFTLL
jgi:hypothetical protein